MRYANGLIIYLLAFAVWVATGAPLADSASPSQPVATTNSSKDAIPSDPELAWKAVNKAFQPPMPPASWQGRQPTPEEFDAFRVERAKLAGDALTLAREFWTRFPDSPRVPEAKKRAESLRFAILNEAAQNSFRTHSRADAADKWVDPENAARDLIHEFPDKKEGYEYLFYIASSTRDEKGRAIVKELLAGKAPEELKTQARGLEWSMDAAGKELDLSFTDIQGTDVDVKTMRDKVVLVDFWATWCGPCVAELPNVKMAYEKLHAKGFEVIGISLDSDKQKLTSFLETKEVKWPQFFDGKGWQNRYAKQFAISSIPTMWLVDKQGKLRDMNARGGLEDKVEKLLAE